MKQKGLSSIMADAINQIVDKIKPKEFETKLTQEEIGQGWTINEAGQKSVGRVWTEIL